MAKRSGYDRIWIHNTGLKTCRTLRSLTMAVKVGGINSVKKSYNIPPCVFISSHGEFSSCKGFLNLAFNFVTLFQQIFTYSAICFQVNFLVSKTPFFTTQKFIFTFLVSFHQFRAFSSQLPQILVKYGLFVYLGIYQRSSHLFCENFPKNVG